MEWFKIKINKIKQKAIYYLSFKKLIESLIGFIQKFYVQSIEFDGVNYGLVNSKKFRINLILCILMWLASFYQLFLITSNALWSLIAGSFHVDHYRLFKSFFLILLFLSSAIKTDILLEEFKLMKSRARSPLRIIYYLMNDLKLKHKLTQKNYDEYVFVSRFVQLYVLNYGAPTTSFLLIGFFTSIFSLEKVPWILDILFIMPFYLYLIFMLAICGSLRHLFYFYYKLLFDQITHQIKSSVSNGRKWFNGRINITLRQERKLIYLIKQHHKATEEINKMNLNQRRRTACDFVAFSLVKIITLYLFMYTKNIMIRGFAINVFAIFVIHAFGLSFVYSLQIESAHQGYKFIHSVICKHKMKLSLRMKVN